MTNNELRIAVAEARGWGEIVPGQFGSLWGVPKILTEQRVQVTLNGKTIEEIPNYPNSMDACETLIDEMTGYRDGLGNYHLAQINIEFYRGEWTAQVYYPDGEPWACSNGGNKSMPEAICDLYLAWKEGQ